MPFKFKPPIRVWAKVAVGLIALDVLLFRVGIFWKMTPNFGAGLGADNWAVLYAAAREFETRPADGHTALIVGSSVVLFGVNETAINDELGRRGVPVKLLRLSTHGSSATDSALMVWNARRMRPWLVIYAAASRDFPKTGLTDSGVIRLFYDSSASLPLLPRRDAEAVLEASVKRYWKLYRYRFFVRQALQSGLIQKWGLPLPALAAGGAPWPLPPEALRYFSPYRVTPERYAEWARWRQSRRFSDYLAWMKGTMAIAQYKFQTLDNFGPLGNPHAQSLRWMLQFLEEDRIRTLLVYFPENPVFRDPEAAPYFDESLSRAYAELFAREAAAHGARFVDLRDFVEPEGFYDLVHLNVVGERKASERVADIIQEEWGARELHGGGSGGR